MFSCGRFEEFGRVVARGRWVLAFGVRVFCCCCCRCRCYTSLSFLLLLLVDGRRNSISTTTNTSRGSRNSPIPHSNESRRCINPPRRPRGQNPRLRLRFRRSRVFPNRTRAKPRLRNVKSAIRRLRLCSHSLGSQHTKQRRERFRRYGCRGSGIVVQNHRREI